MRQIQCSLKHVFIERKNSSPCSVRIDLRTPSGKSGRVTTMSGPSSIQPSVSLAGFLIYSDVKSGPSRQDQEAIGKQLMNENRPYRFPRWSILEIALLSFAAGSLISAQFLQAIEAKADTSHVFELMVYHAKPGKAAELASIFRDVSKLQAKHNLNAVGYWMPEDDPAWKDTFIYLVSHPSREDANKNWNALHTDPTFLPYRKAAAPLIEQVNGAYRVDEIFIRPTEYSAMQ